MKKILTLCIVYNKNRVLLGMKKRGFGEGRWNGFGGKVNPEESISDAALRELREECGITPHDFTARGILRFHYKHTDTTMDVHLFGVTSFDGNPSETEEMKPEWFRIEEIPYASMWPDDPHWLPIFLEGKNIEADFYFSDYDTITKKLITTS